MAYISQSLPLIVAGKQLVYIWYEEITSLSPYTLKDSCSNFAVFHCHLADMLSDLRTLLTIVTAKLSLFLPRDALQCKARYSHSNHVCLSVRLSVCLLRSCIVMK